MTATVRRGTLTAGLVLIAIGVLFFLEIWYEGFSIWHLVGRYWPVLLILVGLSKLYGYFTWQEVLPAPEVRPKE
jgi:LiaI-LiaF-like transmembrane region